ncbi:MAG: branched-chain amino acid ABC transporter permease [Alphaproteobacteria bacterium]|nr:branched-chain amino acid ABC transporter permease [Alphaproteobacteria bacterium]MDP6567743.1 branched-chain amino acid ABC transporter permease [Alphaproteobacteria bacterium]MDP6815198.1 branched-chain amino acid ABC transporter permease [Alphaproteobacteria bacterium]
MAAARIAALGLLLLLSACSRVDNEQARICELLLPALQPGKPRIEVLRREVDAQADHGVVIHYRLDPGDGAPEDHWAACRFAGGGFSQGRRHLVAVVTDQQGQLSEIRLHILRRFWLGWFEARAQVMPGVRAEPAAAGMALLYFLQQSLNALILGAIYSLLAMAYTLVFGLVGRINLAFGELAMVGGFATLVGVQVVVWAGGGGFLPHMIAAGVLAVVCAGAYGLITDRAIFRPLRGRSGQAALIATLGLAVALQEFVRLARGSQDQWLQPVLSDLRVLAAADGFQLTVTDFQLLIVVLVVAVFVLHWRVVDRGPFGRAWRASAQDPGMADLCGIDGGRVSAATFMLGGAYAGLAGWVAVLYYGGASSSMGTMLGFKALTAAIIGGIGSLPGAALGGLLIAGVEVFWAGYISNNYRDMAVFGLLALVLVLRPRGLIDGALFGGESGVGAADRRL